MERSNNKFTGEGPSIIVQEVHGHLIAHSIHQRSPHQNETKERKPIRHNLKRPVPSFTGRENELKELKECLQHQNEEASTSTAAVIIGLGGTGKTELARKYAALSSSYYENIVWVDSETLSSIRSTFETLAKDLGIIKDENEKSKKTTEANDDIIKQEEKSRLEVILPKVYEYLNESKTLLIFDNAEGYPTIEQCLQPLIAENLKNIHILLTSQVKEWKVMDEYITFKECDLEDFLPEHAKEFIKKTLNGKDICDDDIDKLVEEVGCFPLALTQAVAYIKQQHDITQKLIANKTYGIGDYLKAFRDETRKVLDHVNTIVHHRYAKTVYKTLGLTIEKLSKEKNGQEAVNVLTIVAYLAPDDIHVKKMFEGDENAFMLLDKYSMIKIVGGVASIHRLLQQVIRLRNQDNEIENLKKALTVVSYDKGLRYGIYLNHIMFVWSYAIKHNEFIEKVTSYTYTYERYCPLHIFVLNNNYEAVTVLLANIPVEKRKEICNFKGIWDLTPLDVAFETKSSLNMVKLLLQNVAPVQFDKLHRAVKYNADLDVVKYLIKNGAKVNAKNSNGETPLHRAVDCNKNFELVRCLIENGAEINSRNKNGETPLHKVDGYLKRYSRHGTPANNIEMVKILLENGAGMNVKDKNEETPLHAAVAYNKNLKFVKYLIENGAKINVKDKDGRTPLHKAVDNQYDLQFVKYLIKNGAEVNAKDKYGGTALHGAAYMRKNVELVKFLIENGADINVTDDKWISPLHLAMYSHNVESAKYLIENGAVINAKDENGRTALHVALLNSTTNLNTVKFLIAHGADVNAKDEADKTPLFEADNDDLLQLMLQNGADANAKDEDGRTVLHETIRYHRGLNCVKLLIASGADVNAKDKNGKTPLHEAAYWKKQDIIIFLIENGADINAKDNSGAVYNKSKTSCCIS